MGGSTTHDAAAGEGDTWPDVLEGSLRASGRGAVVANAGVDGHSTVGHIRSFDLWFSRIPGLNPRYVLFYLGINDRGIPLDAIDGADTLVHDTALGRFRAYVENNSVLERAARTLRGWWLARAVGAQYGSGKPLAVESRWVTAALPEGWEERLRPRVDAYRCRLAVLHKKVQAFGAIPIYVTQTNGDGRSNGNGVEEIAGSGGGLKFAELAQFNPALLDFCAEKRAACIDLAAELQFKPGDSYDSLHTTPSGSRRIGEYLAGKLAQIVD